MKKRLDSLLHVVVLPYDIPQGNGVSLGKGMVERRQPMENMISERLIPNKIRWYVVLSFSVERKIMKIMVADPITDIEPVTIGMVAPTLNCSGVIDIVRPFQFL